MPRNPIKIYLQIFKDKHTRSYENSTLNCNNSTWEIANVLLQYVYCELRLRGNVQCDQFWRRWETSIIENSRKCLESKQDNLIILWKILAWVCVFKMWKLQCTHSILLCAYCVRIYTWNLKKSFCFYLIVDFLNSLLRNALNTVKHYLILCFASLNTLIKACIILRGKLTWKFIIFSHQLCSLFNDIDVVFSSLKSTEGEMEHLFHNGNIFKNVFYIDVTIYFVISSSKTSKSITIYWPHYFLLIFLFFSS